MPVFSAEGLVSVHLTHAKALERGHTITGGMQPAGADPILVWLCPRCGQVMTWSLVQPGPGLRPAGTMLDEQDCAPR